MRLRAMLVLGMLGLIIGCQSDRPHEYGELRPPVDQVDPRDRGLGGKDLMAATDQMAQSLLALPELNASKTQWTIVAAYMQNQTMQPGVPYDMFIDRLKVNLSKYGRGRVALVENKARFQDLRSRELDQERDDFGQSGGATPRAGGIQPDFFLYGKMQELPNRATSLYRAEFNLTDARTRQVIWSDEYLVAVTRR